MPPIEDCPCWRSHLLLQSAPKPEFWFGESVDFRWNDENSGEFRAERGVVVGVAWNHVERGWEYIITWISSTVSDYADYPIFDGNFVPEETLCRP
jgi:hypothetical protein